MTDITQRLRFADIRELHTAADMAGLSQEFAALLAEIDRLRSDRDCEKRMRKDSDDRAQDLVEEVERLRDELSLCCELKRESQERLAVAVSDIHSCHPACTRAGCVNERLRAALREAADSIESWGAYASPYFAGKHDLAGDVARARAALGE